MNMSRTQATLKPAFGSWLALGLFIASLLLLIFMDIVGREVIAQELFQDNSGILNFILIVSLAGMVAGILLGWRVFWWILTMIAETGPGSYVAYGPGQPSTKIDEGSGNAYPQVA